MQNGMVQQHLYDVQDHFYFGRAQGMHWGDTGLCMRLGYSNHVISNAKQAEIERINDLAPWDRSDIVNQHRSPFEGLSVLVQDHLDSECVSGYSNFHYKLIDRDSIHQADDDAANEWGIGVGDDYYVWSDNLVTTLKGDDSSMPKFPVEYKNHVSLVFIFAYFWNCGLAHSKHSSICTLISGKSCHDKNVQNIVQDQCVEMITNDKLTVWSRKAECFCCYNLEFYFCADWIFECSIFRLLGPTSNHFVHGLTKWVEGKPEIVVNDIEELYAALETGVDSNNFDKSFEECKEEEFCGYTLTDNDTLQHWSENVFKPAIKLVKSRSRRNTWKDKTKQIKKRREVANDESVPMLYRTMRWRYVLLTESFHAFDTYILHLYKYLVYLTHCAFNWPTTETQLWVDEIG